MAGSIQMWSPLSSILPKSLNCRFVMPEASFTFDQLIIAWIEWNWFTISMKMKYEPWRRRDRMRPGHRDLLSFL